MLFFSWHPCHQRLVYNDFRFNCCLSSSHFSVTPFSISNLRFFLSAALFLHSFPTLSMSLLMQSYRNRGLSDFVSPPLSGHLLSLKKLISHSFYMNSSFQPNHRQFLLNKYITPTSTFSSSTLLLSALLAPMILVFTNLDLLLLFLG